MKVSSVSAFAAKAYRGVRNQARADGLLVRGAVLLAGIAIAAACADVLPTAPEPVKEITRRFDTSVGGATVTTDRLDYAPGDTVTITGAGWQPGEIVAFVLNEDPEPTHALYKWTTVASDSGTIFDRSFAPNESHLRVTFRLDATGVTSGRSATRDFTDGNVQVVTSTGAVADLTMTLYGASASCGGSPVNGFPKTEEIDDDTNGSTGKTGAGSNESLRFEAAATATSGAGEFVSWSQLSSPALALAPGYSLTDRIICIVGFQSGNRLLRANYGPAIVATTLSVAGASGTYGGTVNLSATLTRTSGGAAVAGKTIAFTLNGTLVGGATTNASGVATLNSVSLGTTAAGTYPTGVSATFTEDPAESTPRYGGSTASNELTVVKAPLTVTAQNTSRVYGEANPAFSAIFAGFVLSQDFSTSGITGLPSLTTTATAASGVSSYPITAAVGSLVSANYSFTFVDGSLNVTARPITVTADAKTKIYGSADPALTHQVTAGSLVNGDVLGGALTRAAGEGFGTYAITQGTLASGSNYTLTFVGASFTISKRPLTVVANGASRSYGEPNPSFSGTVTGIQGSDAIQVSYEAGSGGTVTAATAVGTYDIIPVVTATPASLLDNYDVSKTNGVLTITARAVTVTAAAQARQYGDSDPPLTYAVTTGSLYGSDAFTGALARAPGNDVGTYPITQGALALSPNYALTFVGADLTVTARAITATADPQTKTYGSSDPALTYTVTAGSLVSGDSFTGSLARAAGENVGSYAINQGTLAISANYALAFNASTLTINAKGLTVTANSSSKTYGDAVTFAGTEFNTSGLVAGDAVSSVTLTSTGAAASAPHGTYDIVASAATGSGLGNYTITYNVGVLTVNKRLATWTTNSNSKTYGNADPAPLTTGSGSNFVAADNVTATYSRAPGETVASSPYAITATLNSSVAGALDNYTITNSGASFTINKRVASWTTNPSSKTYGDIDPGPLTTGSGSNFIAGDGVTATYSRAPGETVAGGPYPITATLSSSVAGALDNYTITNTGASFTISKRLATWNTDPASKTYGDTDPSPLTTGSGSNFVAADNVTATYSRAPGETVASSPYAITATLSSSVAGALDNYTITNAGAGFTINKRLATWTTNPNSKTYGDADPAPLTTGSGSNFTLGDGVTATYSRAPGETVASSPYAITATLSSSVAGALDNYTITNAGAGFTINKRLATWTTNPNSKTYGDADPTPLTSGSGSNFIAADNVTATYSRASGETVDGGPYAITAILASTVTDALDNYTITNAGASFTINKRLATWNTDPASKTYGDADPAPLTTGSGSNFVSGDGVTATYSRAPGETVASSPYAITATLSSSVAGALDNYTITNSGASFTINKRLATWTTNPNSKSYGSPDPVPLTSGAGTNFVSADNVTGTYSRVAGEGSDTSPYQISATLAPAGVLGNYTITNAGAAFTITNDAPVVTGLTGPAAPVRIGAPIVVTGTFSDPGFSGDTYTITSTWTRDTAFGFNQAGVLTSYNPSTGAFSITAPATTPVGVYTVSVTVTDKFGLSGSAALTGYVVVYDANGGFVTGGGWVNSPNGACNLAACASATGRANFGFVAQYKKGATIPDGNTEFQFKAGNLNFKSTVYEWLVIAGSKAQYKGSGTINGAGNYNFMLTAIDGKINGSGGADRFRIKITDALGVVYDNQIGTADSDGLTTTGTLLQGGSITIHK